MSTQPPSPSYAALREQVEGILSEGKLHSRRATEWEKVETYWHIGDAVHRHLGGRPRAEYGQQVVRDLSRDLQMGQTTLWEVLHFRRALPKLSTYGELGWSHMREVLRAPSQDQRLFYLRAAQEGAWSVRQLREAVRADAYGAYAGQPLAVAPDEGQEQDTPLRPRFGDLYTYGVVEGTGTEPAELELDLGFHLAGTLSALGCSRPESPEPGTGSAPAASSPGALQPGAIVSSSLAGSRGTGSRYTLTARTPHTRRFTYLAWTRRIVDGDTLIAIVDLGFGLHTRPIRFRLRGIDCPELSTLAGRTARSFVEERLSEVEFVVLSTHRTDAYGRYLADVRYLPGEPDPHVVRKRGTYLNRQLLEERLARPYER